MTRLPVINARRMIQYLEHLGFHKIRQHGSHGFFRHPDGRTATVPVHSGEDLGRGITNKILHDADVSRAMLINWLEGKKN